jgi:hypothetical protein
MGERGPKPGNAYGAAAVASVFKNADFPISKHDIIECFGDREVEYKKGNPVKVKEILGNIPDETFNSPADLEHAFHERLR